MSDFNHFNDIVQKVRFLVSNGEFRFRTIDIRRDIDVFEFFIMLIATIRRCLIDGGVEICTKDFLENHISVVYF